MLQVNIKSGGVCIKHSLEADFFSASTKRGRERKIRVLRKSATPSLFPDYPRLAQPIPVEKRPTTLASSQARQEHQNKRIRDQIEGFLAADGITTLDDLDHKLLQEKVPRDYRFVTLSNCIKLIPTLHFFFALITLKT